MCARDSECNIYLQLHHVQAPLPPLSPVPSSLSTASPLFAKQSVAGSPFCVGKMLHTPCYLHLAICQKQHTTGLCKILTLNTTLEATGNNLEINQASGRLPSNASEHQFKWNSTVQNIFWSSPACTPASWHTDGCSWTGSCTASAGKQIKKVWQNDHFVLGRIIEIGSS